ncbi:MAG: queuosine precursor transporter [Phycisphaerae bacterium]
MAEGSSHSFVDDKLRERRERVFLVFAGLFLGTLAMLNLLGITRFLTFFTLRIGDVELPFRVAIGVLPYPITFLCTDFISELYGRRRANFVVWAGLGLNLWVILILWLGSVLPPGLPVDPQTGEPLRDAAGRLPVFFEIKRLAFGAVGASMIAYLAAQFCDVYVFHFWKRLTHGRHLWLRNNGSTLVSQLVDTTAVILITHFYAGALPIDGDRPLGPQLLLYIASGYLFKIAVALLDTIPFYLGVKYLSEYLRIDPKREHGL